MAILMKTKLFPLVFINNAAIYSEAASFLLQPARDFPRKCLKRALVGNAKEIQSFLFFDLTLLRQGGNKSGRSHVCLDIT
jgi:hypothetical protein